MAVNVGDKKGMFFPEGTRIQVKMKEGDEWEDKGIIVHSEKNFIINDKSRLKAFFYKILRNIYTALPGKRKKII